MASRARRIVVAFDGSGASHRALDAAADLMGYGSSLSVIHVRRAASESRIVDRAREHLVRRHVTARYMEPCGHAAEEVVEAAREVGADLLVVGRRRNLPEDALDSFSAEIVRRSPCDLLVVS